MKYFIAFLLALLVSTVMLNAEEPAQTTSQPEPLKVPTFKDGDNVYLSVKGNVSRMVIYQSPVGKDEFNSKGFAKDDGYGDYLVPYDKNIDVRIWTREGSNREVMRINAIELLDHLQKKIISNSTDRMKWESIRENRNGKVTFTFAGIQRFYELQFIKIPDGSKYRSSTQYRDGHAPGLRLLIDKNGTYQSSIQASNKSWNTDFPSGKYNRIEVREGIDERFVLRLRDWNTNMYEHPITEFLDISSADFEKGSILEKLYDNLDNLKSAVKLQFRPVKP